MLLFENIHMKFHCKLLNIHELNANISIYFIFFNLMQIRIHANVRLQIKNGTNFLVYDKLAKANIGAKQTVPISFSWLPEKSGIYHLFFDADPSNPIGDTNENNDISFENNFNLIVDKIIHFHHKKQVLDYFNDNNINLQEFYNWLLNNQNNSNSIVVLGDFNYWGIGISINKQMAIQLYQKAANLGSSTAQRNLANKYNIGKGIVRDIDQAIYWYKKFSEQEIQQDIQDKLEELIDIRRFM